MIGGRERAGEAPPTRAADRGYAIPSAMPPVLASSVTPFGPDGKRQCTWGPATILTTRTSCSWRHIPTHRQCRECRDLCDRRNTWHRHRYRGHVRNYQTSLRRLHGDLPKHAAMAVVGLRSVCRGWNPRRIRGRQSESVELPRGLSDQSCERKPRPGCGGTQSGRLLDQRRIITPAHSLIVLATATRWT